jgi:hypothetical protein
MWFSLFFLALEWPSSCSENGSSVVDSKSLSEHVDQQEPLESGHVDSVSESESGSESPLDASDFFAFSISANFVFLKLGFGSLHSSSSESSSERLFFWT